MVEYGLDDFSQASELFTPEDKQQAISEIKELIKKVDLSNYDLELDGITFLYNDLIHLVDEKLKDLMRIMDLDILNIFAEVNDSYREYVESFNQPPENHFRNLSKHSQIEFIKYGTNWSAVWHP